MQWNVAVPSKALLLTQLHISCQAKSVFETSAYAKSLGRLFDRIANRKDQNLDHPIICKASELGKSECLTVMV